MNYFLFCQQTECFVVIAEIVAAQLTAATLSQQYRVTAPRIAAEMMVSNIYHSL